MLAKKYQYIFQNCRPFVISNGANLSHFNMSPLDGTIEKSEQFDCLKMEAAQMFDLVQQCDQVSFGDQGMAMEKWVMFDCAAMPGAIVGFAIEANKLDQNYLKLLKVPKGYQGLVPVSFYMAIPTVEKGSWFGHNLSSLGNRLSTPLPGLGLLTKALAIDVLQIKTMYGATQWGSVAIKIHAALAPMQLMSAYTPAHTHPMSLCYKSNYDRKSIQDVMAQKERVLADHEVLIHDDEARIQALQKQIEAGEKWVLLDKPWREKEQWFYPIAQAAS
jgi:hypothetical protein